MSKKITITLDVSKLKGLTTERSYNNSQGEKVTVKELKFELVPVKQEKVIFSAEKYDLVKTHFACKTQTKEEREAKAETVFLGDGLTTRWKNETPTITEAVVVEDEDPF